MFKGFLNRFSIYFLLDTQPLDKLLIFSPSRENQIGLEKLLQALHRVHVVHLDALDHEGDVIRLAVVVKVRVPVDRIGPLHVPRDGLYGGLVRTHFLEERVIRLQIQHARGLAIV